MVAIIIMMNQIIVNNQLASSLKSWKIMNFRISWESSRKYSEAENEAWDAPHQQEFEKNYQSGDLLHEFPAETRLTVYRRLDKRKQWLSRADLGPHKMMN